MAVARKNYSKDYIANKVYDSTNEVLKTSTTVTSDIQIGAVEIKNATDDTRAVVKTDGTNNALVVTQNSVPTTTVTATDLDIRDLTHVSDSVKIGDGTDVADVVGADDDSTDLEDTNGLVTNAVLNGRISNTAIRPLRIDSSTHSIQTIEYEHHEIHAGSSFVCTDLRNVATTTFKWQVTTPAGTKYAHMIFDLDCTGEMTALVTEGSDRTDGTALVEINRNRVGTPTVATVIVTHTPTGGATDGATTLINHRSGATGVGSKTVAAGGSRAGNEFVLKPSTKYVISVTTYADVWVTLQLGWYEHTDKD